MIGDPFYFRPLRMMTAESPLTSIDVMLDGSTLAVGTTRGKVYIYDLRLGATPIKVLTAHKSSVQSLRFQNGVDSVQVQLEIFSPSDNIFCGSTECCIYLVNDVECFDRDMAVVVITQNLLK